MQRSKEEELTKPFFDRTIRIQEEQAEAMTESWMAESFGREEGAAARVWGGAQPWSH
jgi:hypothetical protein